VLPGKLKEYRDETRIAIAQEKSPREEPGVNPGNTALKSFCPKCPCTSSPSAARKSAI
jgi:hypothetical protein